MNNSVYYDGEKYAEGEIYFYKSFSVLLKTIENYEKIELPIYDINNGEKVAEETFIKSKTGLSNLQERMQKLLELLAKVRSVLSEDASFSSDYFRYMNGSISANDIVNFRSISSLIDSTMLSGIGQSYYEYIVFCHDYEIDNDAYSMNTFTYEDYCYALLWLKKQDLLKKYTIAEATASHNTLGKEYYWKKIRELDVEMFLIQRIQNDNLNQEYSDKYDESIAENKSYYLKLLHDTSSEGEALLTLISNLSMNTYGADFYVNHYADAESYATHKATEIYHSLLTKFDYYDLHPHIAPNEYDLYNTNTTDYYEELPSVFEISNTVGAYTNAFVIGGLCDFIEDPIKAIRILDVHTSDLSEEWKQYKAKKLDDYSFYTDTIVQYDENGNALYLGNYSTLIDRDDVKGASQKGKKVIQVSTYAVSSVYNPYWIAQAGYKTFIESTDKVVDLNKKYVKGEITSDKLKLDTFFYTCKQSAVNGASYYLGSEVAKAKHPFFTSNLGKKTVDGSIKFGFDTVKAIATRDYSELVSSFGSASSGIVFASLGESDNGIGGKVAEKYATETTALNSPGKVAFNVGLKAIEEVEKSFFKK